MSRSDAHILRKLISVKKQRAEQQLIEIQAAIKEVERQFQEMQQMLCEGSVVAPENFEALTIAIRNRFPERVIRDLETLKQQRQNLIRKKASIERELRTALHAKAELSAPNARKNANQN